VDVFVVAPQRLGELVDAARLAAGDVAQQFQVSVVAANSSEGEPKLMMGTMFSSPASIRRQTDAASFNAWAGVVMVISTLLMCPTPSPRGGRSRCKNP